MQGKRPASSRMKEWSCAANGVLQYICTAPKTAGNLVRTAVGLGQLDDVAFHSCCRSGSSNLHSYCSNPTAKFFSNAFCPSFHRDFVISRLLTLARIGLEANARYGCNIDPSMAPLVDYSTY